MKRFLYFLRWGHWPKRMRYPNGIPRTEFNIHEQSRTFTVERDGRLTLFDLDTLAILAETGEPE